MTRNAIQSADANAGAKTDLSVIHNRYAVARGASLPSLGSLLNDPRLDVHQVKSHAETNEPKQ